VDPDNPEEIKAYNTPLIDTWEEKEEEEPEES